MHLSTRSYLISVLLSGARAVDIDFFPQRDNYCSTYAFATCYDISPGECCTWNGNPSQGSFGSARVSGMTGLSTGGVFNGGVGGCYNNACSLGSDCLNCGSAIHGVKWATVNNRAGGRNMPSAGIASTHSIGPGGKKVGAQPRNGRRSLQSSDQSSPWAGGNNVGAKPNNQNVGAVPNSHNVGAVPNVAPGYQGPRNVGATPRDPLQDLLNQFKGDPYPEYPNNGYSGSNNGYSGYPNSYDDGNVGATRNDPWSQFFEKLRQWGARNWGKKQSKRSVGRTVSPNRATIGGHRFNLDLMPNDQRFEMYDAIFNQTQYEDLSKSLLEFEIAKN